MEEVSAITLRSGRKVETKLPTQDIQVSTLNSELNIDEKKNEGEIGNITSCYLLPELEHIDIGSLSYPTHILQDKHD